MLSDPLNSFEDYVFGDSPLFSPECSLIGGVLLQATEESAVDNRVEATAAFIESVYRLGGKPFVEAVARYGYTEKGEPLQITPWFAEYLEAIGDLRLAHVLTTGPAQCGKTLGNTLLLTYLVIEGRLNTAWFYSTAKNLELNVPEQFRPIAEAWADAVEQEGRKVRDKSDRKLNSRYQFGGITTIFSFASGNRATPSKSGLAAVGSSAASFPANAAFLEERSQWPPGSADPIPRRLDASRLETKPLREIGTPGAGQGIEAEVETADHHFYPHYVCPHCDAVQPLDPKGCLLRLVSRRGAGGRVEEKYLSESGRPLEWYYSDDAEPVHSAFIGCSKCGEPLPDEARFDAHFRCLKMGISLREYLDSLPSEAPDRRLKVAVHLSPLTRKTKFNLAADLIQNGLSCYRTEDWQQQALGHPSESGQGSITLQLLKDAIAAAKPTGVPDFVLAGGDQGRAEDWLMVVEFYQPTDYHQLSVSEIIDRTVRSIRFGGDVMRDAIPGKLKDLGVEYGLIDNEPNRSDAADLCRISCLEMANQQPGLKDAVKQGEVHDGGAAYPCWQLRNEKFLKQVLDAFLRTTDDGHPLYRLPPEWRKWLGNPSERSPLAHLMGPSYDPASGKWSRGKGGIDDLYYALMFAEAAFYLQLTEKRTGTQCAPIATSEEHSAANIRGIFGSSDGTGRIQF